MTKGENPLIRRIPVKDREGKVIGQKEVVGYRGLLDMVHKERLQAIRTRLLQAPSKENGETAIVHATVITSRGTFTGIGDANPKNVNPKVAPHSIRMAETRAEARAMRKAVNIGVVAIEELGDDLSDDLTYEGMMKPASTPRTEDRASVEPRATAPKTDARPDDRNGGTASENQIRYLFRLVAEKGLEGEAAKAYLHRELGVGSVREASRTKASMLIERLKSNGLDAPAKAAGGEAA